MAVPPPPPPLPPLPVLPLGNGAQSQAPPLPPPPLPSQATSVGSSNHGQTDPSDVTATLASPPPPAPPPPMPLPRPSTGSEKSARPPPPPPPFPPTTTLGNADVMPALPTATPTALAPPPPPLAPQAHATQTGSTSASPPPPPPPPPAHVTQTGPSSASPPPPPPPPPQAHATQPGSTNASPPPPPPPPPAHVQQTGSKSASTPPPPPPPMSAPNDFGSKGAPPPPPSPLEASNIQSKPEPVQSTNSGDDAAKKVADVGVPGASVTARGIQPLTAIPPVEHGSRNSEESDTAEVMVKTEFVWADGAQDDVKLSGAWNSWLPIQMYHEGGGMWSVVTPVPAGTHEFKFIVDGSWRFSTRHPTVGDTGDSTNNIRVIKGPPKQQRTEMVSTPLSGAVPEGARNRRRGCCVLL